MTFETSTTGFAQTKELGAKLGRLLHGGEVVELVGDVGAGKTTLVQGVVKAMGFSGPVPSPTFTISRVYPLSEGRELHHFDFYRLSGADIVATELAEVLSNPSATVVVEWAENMGSVLPDDRLRINLTSSKSENARHILIKAFGERHKHIVKELK